jgi:hypothetical protein
LPSICEHLETQHKADKGDVPYGECQPSAISIKCEPDGNPKRKRDLGQSPYKDKQKQNTNCFVNGRNSVAAVLVAAAHFGIAETNHQIAEQLPLWYCRH